MTTERIAYFFALACCAATGVPDAAIARERTRRAFRDVAPVAALPTPSTGAAAAA